MIRKLFLENLPLKASAVALAVILWFFVISKGQTEISLTAPLEYTNIPAGLEIAKRTVSSVNIVIRTHESVAKNVRQELVRAYIDVGKARRGEGTFSIRKDDVKMPFGATVLKIEPSSIKVVFEETVSKKIAISPDIMGSPDKDYYVKAVEVRPDEVIIEGPKSEVRKLVALKTEPIDISGSAEDFSQEVELAPRSGNIRIKPDRVDVHVRIVRRGK